MRGYRFFRVKSFKSAPLDLIRPAPASALSTEEFGCLSIFTPLCNPLRLCRGDSFFFGQNWRGVDAFTGWRGGGGDDDYYLETGEMNERIDDCYLSVLHAAICHAIQSISGLRIYIAIPRGRSLFVSRSAIVRHPQAGAVTLGKGNTAGVGEVGADAQPIRQLGLADERVDHLPRRVAWVRLELGGADLADGRGGVGPADVDAARRARQGPVGAVDVDVLAAGGGDGEAWREVGFELAAVGAGRHGELDEHVVLGAGAGALADEEPREVGFHRLGLRDARVFRVDGRACRRSLHWWGVWCREDRGWEDGERQGGDDGLEIHDFGVGLASTGSTGKD